MIDLTNREFDPNSPPPLPFFPHQNGTPPSADVLESVTKASRVTRKATDDFTRDCILAALEHQGVEIAEDEKAIADQITKHIDPAKFSIARKDSVDIGVAQVTSEKAVRDASFTGYVLSCFYDGDLMGTMTVSISETGISFDISIRTGDVPAFALMRFNERRRSRGAPAAQIKVTWPNGDSNVLWMSKDDLEGNIREWGEDTALVAALGKYV